MKTKLLFIQLLLGLNCVAQDYIFDDTFGTNGIKTTIINSFTPINGEIINNFYYLNSENKITKIDYNGNIVNSFGTNGFISLNTTVKTFQISNFKFINGYFYFYGNANSPATSSLNVNQDIFIYKINESGVADSSFGTDGLVTFDFGNNEVITDFIMESNGSLLCVGNLNFPVGNTSQISSKIIYFKLNNNGTINYSYDSTGFKSYSLTLPNMLNQKTEVQSIYPFNGKFLLAGLHTASQLVDNNSFPKDALLLTTIDNAGNIDPSYGTSGYRLQILDAAGGKTLKNIQKVDNNLYVKYFYNWSFNNQGTKIAKYDLVSNQFIFEKLNMYESYLKPEADGFFLTGYDKCFGSGCLRKFELKKFHADGSADTSFGNAGSFSYRFPNNLREDVSTIYVKDPSGKIMIGGLSDNRFSMIRLKNGTLENEDFTTNNISISPNPFTDKININSNVAIKSIEIIDLLGRKIDESEFTQNSNNSYNLAPNIPKSGIFLIKITTSDNKIILKKIVKN